MFSPVYPARTTATTTRLVEEKGSNSEVSNIDQIRRPLTMCRTCEIEKTRGVKVWEPLKETAACEYNPDVRYLKDSDGDSDDNSVCVDAHCEGECITDPRRPPTGVPDQVRGPDGQWLDTLIWQWRVASKWKRMGDEVLPPLSASSPASGPVVPDAIDFMQVVRHRISSHRKYATAVYFGLGLQKSGLHRTDPALRRDFILHSLGIDDPTLEDHDELLAWLESSIVHIPWNDYLHGYDHLSASTQNPLWSRVQWTLSNSNRERGWSDWERLGYGDWTRPIDKSGWTHEDHACRFVLHFYDLLTHPELPHEYAIRRNLAINHRIGQWTAEAWDKDDKAWFGYGLFCLLIRSWQYKQHSANSHWECDQGLVPAMYENYTPHLFFDYPLVQVGQVNLNPLTPWVHKDDMPKNIEDLIGAQDHAMNAVAREKQQFIQHIMGIWGEEGEQEETDGQARCNTQ